jgi:hypothetical protein
LVIVPAPVESWKVREADSLAVVSEVVDGMKRTVTVHPVPAATGVPTAHVVDAPLTIVKSLAFVPVTEMLLMLRAALTFVFVSVTGIVGKVGAGPCVMVQVPAP